MLEPRKLTFRKEEFSYVAQYYICVDTKEQFSTTELDTLNINQVYNQYRVKYGIPFPDEIAEVRKRYGLSAAKMSEILGFGVNQYRLYENGEMPSEANGKVLQGIQDSMVFATFVKNAKNQFAPDEYKKILEKNEASLRKSKENSEDDGMFTKYSRSSFNGYAPLSHRRMKNIILYFISKCGGVFNTKMNKLLFYADFLSYKRHGIGISGLRYVAIQYGPVPVRWDVIYGSIDEVNSEIVAFPSGNSGVNLCSDAKPDMSIFSKEEISILDYVLEKFRNLKSNELSVISHQEDAWKKYVNKRMLIDYSEAFTLKGL